METHTTTTTTTARKIAYVSGNQGTHEFEIHRAGCAHTKRNRLHPWANLSIHELAEGETAEDFVASEVQVYEYQEQGWGRGDFRIFPCVGKAN